MPIAGDRESYRYNVELGFKANQSLIELQPYAVYEDIYMPMLISMESLDMFAGDPEAQQCALEVEYELDNYCVTSESLCRNL